MRNFVLIVFIVCAGVAVSAAQTSTKKKVKNYKGGERTLARFYSLRSYDGAPPVIPHPVLRESYGGKNCLQCHQNGDYVPQWQAYAPKTPHPELSSCRQCHVSQVTQRTQVANFFLGKKADRAKSKPALQGQPLLIPHELFMRKDCLSCHAGNHAVKEIRTTHPERLSCQQCHVAPEAPAGQN